MTPARAAPALRYGPSRSRRFPIGLTLVSAIAFAVMIGLGLWQVQRFQWKQHVLARIAALRTAPAQPIGPVLARAARGEDVDFTRVWADCGRAPPRPARYVMGVETGQYIWHPYVACGIDAPPFDGLVVDRGIAEATRGQTSPAAVNLPAPGHVVGILLASDAKAGSAELRRPAPVVLVAESESPPAPGVTPMGAPNHAPDNLQYVGEYAPTWFGLAGVLAAFYAAMLWRRRRS